MTRLTLVALMLVVTSNVWSQEKEKAIETKAKDAKSAITTDFATSLQLPFDSLNTLGVRIENARKVADPVGMAVAALELAAAEKASGKTAAIKAADLKEEAISLAKLRADVAELTAVESLFGMDLGKEIKASEKRQKEAQAAAKEGEKSRGIFHELVVDNGSEVHVHI